MKSTSAGKETAENKDDPARFSAIFRMFEAKPKSETSVMTVDPRSPRPSNRLRAKKPSVTLGTMTDPCDDDDDLPSAGPGGAAASWADADSQACFSSTFERRPDDTGTEEADFFGSSDEEEGRGGSVSDAKCRCHLKDRAGETSPDAGRDGSRFPSKEGNRKNEVSRCRHCLKEKAENNSSGCKSENGSGSTAGGIDGRSGMGGNKCSIALLVEGRDVIRQNATGETKAVARGGRSETQLDADDVRGANDVTDGGDGSECPDPPDERFLRLGKSADWQDGDEGIYVNAAEDKRVRWQGAPDEGKSELNAGGGGGGGGGGEGAGGAVGRGGVGHHISDSGTGREVACSRKGTSHHNEGGEADDRRKETSGSGCHQSISGSRNAETENVSQSIYANASNNSVDDYFKSKRSNGVELTGQNQDQSIRGKDFGSANGRPSASLSNEQKTREESRKVNLKPETADPVSMATIRMRRCVDKGGEQVESTSSAHGSSSSSSTSSSSSSSSSSISSSSSLPESKRPLGLQTKSMATNTEEGEKSSAEFECQTEEEEQTTDALSHPKSVARDQSTDCDDCFTSYFWFFDGVDRTKSEELLKPMIELSGSYLVRKSVRGGECSQYTLSVVYKRHIYHVLIRRRSDKRFAIGKEKDLEKVFHTIPDLMGFYQNNFVELIGDANKQTASGRVQLRNCPPK